MPVWLAIVVGALSFASVALLSYWTVVAVHVIRTMVRLPSLREALAMPGPERWPPVCIIVPAHNEERGIGALLDSLKQQDYADFHVVFALDRCTDGTRDILTRGIGADGRFEIVEIDACPEGWVGKVHAIWAGVTRSAAPGSADLLLFLDADTYLQAPCVRAAVTLLRNRNLQMLSLLSTLTAEKWFEKVVQPAAGMDLMRQYPIVRANSKEERRAFANGQFILVTREAYESIGGHTAVRSEVLDDVWLARRLVYKGYDIGLFLANGLLVCRMYATWDTFRRGWVRIFGECANRKPRRLWEAAWRLRLVATILPLCAAACFALSLLTGAAAGDILACIALGTSVLGLGVYFGVIGLTYYVGRTPLAFVATYPAGAWLAASIMLRAARELKSGSPTLWGGKSYVRDVR